MSKIGYDLSHIFTERLRELRKAKGMSQKVLAESIGFTQAKICKWEKGVNRPNYEGLCLIAKVLNTTTDFLLGTVEEQRRADMSYLVTGADILPCRYCGGEMRLRENAESGISDRLVCINCGLTFSLSISEYDSAVWNALIDKWNKTNV